MILRSRRAAARGPAAVVTSGLALALLLAGCTAEGGPEAGASATPSGSASASGEPADEATDGPMDATQACAAMFVSGEEQLDDEVASALLDVSKDGLGSGNADRMHALGLRLGRLENRVPAEFQEPLQKIRVPFLQVQESLDAMDGGDIQLDIGSATDGLKEYTALCS
ncbi:hypothetical protein [Antribacter gilvus]|uniref:hypothetical protein n=1 Tax=Antribacter gilvus TaxID=2304675 RepID=UPI000F7B59BB|nr:hypothetical protein [Antribacter gilvus]